MPNQLILINAIVPPCVSLNLNISASWEGEWVPFNLIALNRATEEAAASSLLHHTVHRGKAVRGSYPGEERREESAEQTLIRVDEEECPRFLLIGGRGEGGGNRVERRMKRWKSRGGAGLCLNLGSASVEACI